MYFAVYKMHENSFLVAVLCKMFLSSACLRLSDGMVYFYHEYLHLMSDFFPVLRCWKFAVWLCHKPEYVFIKVDKTQPVLSIKEANEIFDLGFKGLSHDDASNMMIMNRWWRINYCMEVIVDVSKEYGRFIETRSWLIWGKKGWKLHIGTRVHHQF